MTLYFQSVQDVVQSVVSQCFSVLPVSDLMIACTSEKHGRDWLLEYIRAANESRCPLPGCVMLELCFNNNNNCCSEDLRATSCREGFSMCAYISAEHCHKWSPTWVYGAKFLFKILNIVLKKQLSLIRYVPDHECLKKVTRHFPIQMIRKSNTKTTLNTKSDWIKMPRIKQILLIWTFSYVDWL